MSGTNDLVVKFANVNGSGSASANGFFAKALFRMGLAVSPKNIFPSNIQGLPTWFEVRVSEAGYYGRRDGIDLMVAMNPQSYGEDAAEVVPGGYLFYDSTLERDFGRDDITVLAMPISRLCAYAFEAPRERQLFKNVVYLGALAALLDIEIKILELVIRQKLGKKEKLFEANLKALHMGRDYALQNFDCPLPIKFRLNRDAPDKIMISGNEAAGLGCIYAGATVAAWYPITPSTSLAEAFEHYLGQMRIDEHGRKLGAVVQAEDELAAIGIAVGASWNGARSFTATSGPGISLMNEFIGLAYFAEVPVVIFDIQRGGPSTGMPTRTQQSDVLACAYASHGDTRHVLLIPADPRECFEFAAQAFDLAERLQTPVFVLSDLDIGMNEWAVDPLEWDDERQYDRGKLLDAAALDRVEQFGRYLDVDGDGIPYRTIPGAHPTKGAYFTRGSSHNAYAGYTEDGAINAENMRRLTRKFDTAAELVPEPVVDMRDGGGSVGLIYFGSTHPAVMEALDLLQSQGHAVNSLRLRGFPFSAQVADFAAAHERVLVLEQNRDAQMRTLLMAEADIAGEKLIPVLNFDGMPLSAAFVADAVRPMLAGTDAEAADEPPAFRVV
jgi:2-oxoglutarate ferredoxin oxidoreductase subunit alpha